MNDKELIEKIKDAEVHHRLRAMGAILHMAGLQNKVMQEKVVSMMPWYSFDSAKMPKALFENMQGHMDQLNSHINHISTPSEVIKECVHIANYATMIVDLMEQSTK